MIIEILWFNNEHFQRIRLENPKRKAVKSTRAHLSPLELRRHQRVVHIIPFDQLPDAPGAEIALQPEHLEEDIKQLQEYYPEEWWMAAHLVQSQLE